jgi:predicted N-acetyltransferase YhbS
MIADYAADLTLYDQCLTLIDACFPGIKTLADKGRRHNAYWDKASTPFIIKEKGKVIAHLGVLPYDFMMEGKSYHAAAIHGVCTQEGHRNKGYFKQLMQEALQFTQKEYDFSFLFTGQPHLYERYGFKVVPEYDFIYDFASPQKSGALRKLDLDKAEDLTLLQDHYKNRIPLSNHFSIIKETTIATLNALHEPVYYIEAIDGLIVYEVKETVLYLKDIVTTKPCELGVVLNSIPDTFLKVVLQFSPDKFLKLTLQVINAAPECYFMTSKDFGIKCQTFRFPEPQRC